MSQLWSLLWRTAAAQIGGDITLADEECFQGNGWVWLAFKDKAGPTQQGTEPADRTWKKQIPTGALTASAACETAVWAQVWATQSSPPSLCYFFSSVNFIMGSKFSHLNIDVFLLFLSHFAFETHHIWLLCLRTRQKGFFFIWSMVASLCPQQHSFLLSGLYFLVLQSLQVTRGLKILIWELPEINSYILSKLHRKTVVC